MELKTIRPVMQQEGAMSRYFYLSTEQESHMIAEKFNLLHKTKAPPARQSVAAIIKEAIINFPAGRKFSTKDVFEALPEKHLDYEKTRLSISAWLQDFVKKGEVIKLERGLYMIPPVFTRKS